MADQPELDLPPVPPPAPIPPGAKRNSGFGGFSPLQIVVGLLVIASAVWGMWVTRTLTATKQEHIVSARLSALVGDYVEAQRFSGSPPERVRAEMAAFMSSLDKELQRRSASGQVVLVGEAVLTRNIPDITDSLKNAVFASGVPEPKRLSVEELQRLQELSVAQSAITNVRQATPGGSGPFDPMSAIPAPSGVGSTAPVAPAQQMPAPPAGAAVSTFGERDGNGGQ